MLHSARITILAVVALGAAVACGGSSESFGDDSIGEGTEALTLKSYPYNRPKQSHADLCVALKDKNGLRAAPLRYADGTGTGHGIADVLLEPTPGSRTIVCPKGYARFDAREFVETPAGRKMLFHRGGWGYVGGDGGGVRYGHVVIDDLDASTAVRWDSKQDAFVPAPLAPWTTSAMEGPQANGSACEGPLVTYRTQVAPIPDGLRYLGSTPWNVTSYKNYGDAAWMGGKPGDPKYTMLSWSWINVQGGGVARALVGDGKPFYRCKDVRSIKLFTVDKPTWALVNGKPVEMANDDPNKGHRNGWVQAVYGAIDGGKGKLYGWMTYAHQECTTGIDRDANGKPSCAAGSKAAVYHLVR